MKRLPLALLAILGMGAALSSCNMFGEVDHATTREELIEEAKAALDNGNCDRVLAAVGAIGGYDDEIFKLQGWGELCGAGITVNKVGKTLFNYKPTDATNYQIVGQLANSLVPADEIHLQRVDRAIRTFSAIKDRNTRSANLILAHISKAAILIARRSADRVKARRADIYSAAGCVGATCTSNPAACGAGMADADANAAADSFDAAATEANSFTELGAVRDLARSLGDNTGLPNVTRCIIVNNMLSE